MGRSEWKEYWRRLRVTRLRMKFATFAGQTVNIPSSDDAIRLQIKEKPTNPEN